MASGGGRGGRRCSRRRGGVEHGLVRAELTLEVDQVAGGLERAELRAVGDLVLDHLAALGQVGVLGAVHLGSSIAAADDLDRTGFIAWSVSNNTQVIFSGGYTYDARHAS